MTSHVSATAREETPHVKQTSKTTISDGLRRRAQSVINDKSIDAQRRAIIRYGLEINDPWLAELVSRANAGEKIEALAEIICRAGDESAAALLVLMGKLQNSADPNALANTVKHLAFTRCGELNVHGIVDAQIAIVEGELLRDTLTP